MFGGCISVAKKLKVKNIIISKQIEETENLKKMLNIINEKNINLIVVEKGDEIKIGKYLKINILWPEMGKNIDLNNNSIIAKFIYRDVSMIFTGDIEKEAESEILKIYGETNILNADILKVAHHGSKTSSTNEILNQITPKISLIGVGENNQFGHPDPEVLNRLQKIKSKIYRTDEDGEIIINIKSKGRIKLKIEK